MGLAELLATGQQVSQIGIFDNILFQAVSPLSQYFAQIVSFVETKKWVWIRREYKSLRFSTDAERYIYFRFSCWIWKQYVHLQCRSL